MKNGKSRKKYIVLIVVACVVCALLAFALPEFIKSVKSKGLVRSETVYTVLTVLLILPVLLIVLFIASLLRKKYVVGKNAPVVIAAAGVPVSGESKTEKRRAKKSSRERKPHGFICSDKSTNGVRNTDGKITTRT